MQLGALPEAESWILSWGDQVEVLAPAELIRRIHDTVVRLVAQYKREN